MPDTALGDIATVRADVATKFKSTLTSLESRIAALCDGALSAMKALKEEATELGGKCEEALTTSKDTLDKALGMVETAAAKLDTLVDKTPHLDALLVSVPAGNQARQEERLAVITLAHASLVEMQTHVDAAVTRANTCLEEMSSKYQPALEGVLDQAKAHLSSLAASADAAAGQMTSSLQTLQGVIETQLDQATTTANDESETMLSGLESMVTGIFGSLTNDTHGAMDAFMNLSGAYEEFDARYGDELGQFLDAADEIISLIKQIEPVLDLIQALK